VELQEDVLVGLNTWLGFFRSLWWGEIPMKIHQRDFDEGGFPEWHPDFARWMFADPPEREKVYGRRDEDPRLRTTRAFRKLRRKAPREFDVLYLLVAKRPPMGLIQIAAALNARAERNGKVDRYETQDVMILAISGLDKALKWW